MTAERIAAALAACRPGRTVDGRPADGLPFQSTERGARMRQWRIDRDALADVLADGPAFDRAAFVAATDA